MDNTLPVIREARPSDAEKMIGYMQALIAEPGIDLAITPEEFNMSLEDEQEFVRDHALAENSLLIVAELDGEIVGILNCSGGRRLSTRHSARLGISVRKDLRDRGLGRRLMEYAVEWAQGSGIIKRLELEVFARNARGIHLYEKMGFEVEGRLRRAHYKDGQYLDSLIMARLFQ